MRVNHEVLSGDDEPRSLVLDHNEKISEISQVSAHLNEDNPIRIVGIQPVRYVHLKLERNLVLHLIRESRIPHTKDAM